MSGPLPKLQAIPHTIATVGDYEAAARERLSEPAWAYLSGGASDEVTVARNVGAFSQLTLRTRVFADLTDGHTNLELFNQSFGLPILLAPVAFHRLAHPDGELATALGASAGGAGLVVSTQASVTLEDVASQAATPLWFQLYIQPDRAVTLDLVRRAEAAGYGALVVTADAPISGFRPREQRAAFRLPPEIEAANLRGVPPPPSHTARAGQPVLLGGPLLAAAATWRDFAWLRSQTSLPILVKGVMTAEDAVRALDEGADGVIVSNHGGRVLDGQPASLDVLPEVTGIVGDRAPVLFDGGVRSGGDAFKALALGARAVLIGRPYIWGLAAAGAVGVSHVIHMLRAELEATMALTGRHRLSEIDRTALRS